MGLALSRDAGETKTQVPPVLPQNDLQVRLQSGIKSRETECRMIRVKIKQSEESRSLAFARKDTSAARVHHADVVSHRAQINAVKASIRTLENELQKMYTAAMHKETMQLMKDSAKHLYKVNAGPATVENAIAYTDALADAHANIEEVGDILQADAGNAPPDDAEWLALLAEHTSSPAVTPAAPQPAPAYPPVPVVAPPTPTPAAVSAQAAVML